MADTKISALPAVTVPAGTDEFAINQAGVSNKITLAQIMAYIESLLALDLANGGTGSDLSATGPGFLKQGSAGANVTVEAIAAGDLPTGIDAANISGGAVSNTEFDYIGALTGDAQFQIDNKAPLAHKDRHLAGGADEFIDGDELNAIARLVVKIAGATIGAYGRRAINLRTGGGSGLTFTATDSSVDEHTDILLDLSSIDATKVGGGLVDNTEFSYLNGVTGTIQTQIDNKAALVHKSRHVAGGADEFVAGDLLNAVARVIVKNAGSTVYANGRRGLNFIAGPGLSITITDGSADEHTNVALALSGGGTAGAMVHIQTITLSGAGTFDFTGIPATYRHLRLIGSVRSAEAVDNVDGVLMQFNGDGGANYASAYLSVTNPGDGGVQGNANYGQEYMEIAGCPCDGTIANYFSSLESTIPNYTSTSFYKNAKTLYLEDVNGTTMYSGETGGTWESTDAINQITVFSGDGNFVAGSTLSLYGVL